MIMKKGVCCFMLVFYLIPVILFSQPKNKKWHALLYSFTEFSRINYHNLRLYPLEYFITAGVGVYIPVLFSGSFTAGGTIECKAGQSLMVENSIHVSLPVYATVRYKPFYDANSHWGAAVGSGSEWFYRQGELNTPRESLVQFGIFAEISYNFGKNLILLRYNQSILSGKFTRRGLVIGYMYEL
jgi:hypothetical protein